MSEPSIEAMDPSHGSHGTMKIENTEKRDALRAVEKRYQNIWQEEKVFEADAPSCTEYPPGSITDDALRAAVPKFFGTMAYPYVNGSAHLGHAFTMSKIEFGSRVARAQGKRTLYPQGYHATGMPIKACADKLVHEIELFGKNLERYEEGSIDEAPLPIQEQPQQRGDDVTKFTNVRKGKAALKTTKAKYQFQVMLSLGIPRTDIHKFADAQYWLRFFPQLWQEHLSAFGCGIDWRRGFITTDANLYYDSFVRWQMRRLKALGKIQFGKRYSIYSPKDRQPCLDHDRAEGESVRVQEYTIIKCKVVQWSERTQNILSGKIPDDANVFMVPATLRPETMYGQTNLFVSPSITYGVFRVSEKDFFFMTNRAARNLAFQGIFPEWGNFPKVAELNGYDVIGSVVNAPMSQLQNVYVVPMDTIKEDKGTGVVTSVPSDSPDDYTMTIELSKKADYYGIRAEWVPLDILPIIDTPGYGNLIAPTLCKNMRINTPKSSQLPEAKEQAYKIGFYQGKMLVGEFSGKPVQEAKNLVRQSLLDTNDAIAYCEPDGLAISRSGDECVAAYLDQWFLTYGPGDEAWREDVLGHVRGEDGQNFNSFTSATKNAIEHTLGWLTQWCVTRQYGLGTKLPWDESELVEGLSDSTIYMAYYTIAHYLHSDIYGTKRGIGNIEASQMTDEVWDYVFAIRDHVTATDINKDVLEVMRREFTYWYPVDIRVSGKDLITNHLTFFLYIHQALWGKSPQYLPKAIRINGHVTLNGGKMSKSTGNFLTLDTAIQKFGADATRIALADAGDGIEDANFEETVANAIVLKLFELRKWSEDVISGVRILKESENFVSVRDSERIKNGDTIQRTGQKLFWDELFENELKILVQETVQQFEATNYKAALKSGFYDFVAARDSYRVYTASASLGMHQHCVRRYVELQALMICVITPHWADYIWREVLKKNSTIQAARFPQVDSSNPSLIATSQYIRSVLTSVSAADSTQQKRLAKGKDVRYNPKQPKRLTVFVAKSWPAWQTKYIDLVREMLDGISLDVKEVIKKVDKKDMKKAMPFIQRLNRRLASGEPKAAVFERNLGFDEVQVLKELVSGLTSMMPKLKEVEIVCVEEGSGVGFRVNGKEEERVEDLPQAAGSAEPGSPSFHLANLESS
ncbi:leucyl-tRNA synthetase-like protein [Amniculicola lignicola CBS 123094]|uniref:leucine--tRNA ligase n=1 Tax=Amniculicola lignicola CBS 123094 TaxID=1392246 RepID=A0A6A5W7A1_9PLEO|nr:leucyl-tRNA synthetase-like protein [Amniculicola lignicola CBS 123094]